jgi:hypothetical protein
VRARGSIHFSCAAPPLTAIALLTKGGKRRGPAPVLAFLCLFHRAAGGCSSCGRARRSVRGPGSQLSATAERAHRPPFSRGQGGPRGMAAVRAKAGIFEVENPTPLTPACGAEAAHAVSPASSARSVGSSHPLPALSADEVPAWEIRIALRLDRVANSVDGGPSFSSWQVAGGGDRTPPIDRGIRPLLSFPHPGAADAARLEPSVCDRARSSPSASPTFPRHGLCLAAGAGPGRRRGRISAGALAPARAAGARGLWRILLACRTQGGLGTTRSGGSDRVALRRQQALGGRSPGSSAKRNQYKSWATSARRTGGSGEARRGRNRNVGDLDLRAVLG